MKAHFAKRNTLLTPFLGYSMVSFIRYTSIVGWNSAQRRWTARNAALSFVSNPSDAESIFSDAQNKSEKHSSYSPSIAGYFVCSSNLAVCRPKASEGERRRREASTEASPTQLVTLGPFLLRRNSTKKQADPCVQHNTGESRSTQAATTPVAKI